MARRDAWKLTTNRPTPTAESGVGPAKLSFTAAAPVAGAWLQIELPETTTLSELRLSSANSPRNFTRAYRIELSTDGENWGEPVATGRGLGPIVDVTFTPTKAKWVRITHTQAQFGFGRGRGAAPGASGPADTTTSTTATDTSAVGETASRGGATNAGGRGRGAGAAPAGSDWTLDDVQLFQPIPTAATATP